MRLALVPAFVLALAPVAQADSIDVPSAAHLTIVGERGNVGAEVAGAGDVNGDGVPDVLVSDPGGDNEADAVYVVFGRRTPGTVNLGSLGNGGFKITGASDAVAGAGDVNGDGLADVLVGDYQADFNGRENSGSAYVVFGKPTSGAVDLAALGNGGFRIDGPLAIGAGLPLFELVSLDGAGDVNGDGRGDVVVGFEQAYCFSMLQVCTDQTGTAYVIFGKASGGAVDTAAPGSAGYSIGGTPVGATVAGLGDFNGDGIPDVAVSRRYNNAGWVVFGRRPAVNVDLTALSANGFKVVDGTETDVGGGQQQVLGSVAWTLAGTGDVNGDGRRDLLVGSGQGLLCCTFQKRAAAIFGGPSTADVDLASLGTRGFLVTGGNQLGFANAAGDASGDGRADLLVNAGGDGLGVAAVFGKASTTTVDVTALGSQGVYLTGAWPSNRPDHRPFAGAGDMTGDGVADVVVGSASGSAGVGHAYVVSLKPSPLRLIAELRFQIASFGLPTKLRDRFLRRLNRIKFVYVSGDQAGACRRIDRLIAFAQRLNGTRLTAAQTYTIVSGANKIAKAAGCG